jgi:serine/threonine protein kinase/tetratricopeptide (TPR) repeat protein
MPSADAEDFSGTDRFSIESCLGTGGFGVVYRAYDRKREGVVALKTLRRADSDSLYRFKQEFRSLADIAHPNLVTLYELTSDREVWFFTMELVHGVNFLDHVRGRLAGEGSAAAGDSRHSASPTGATLPDPPRFESGAARRLLRFGLTERAEAEDAAMPVGPERLRSALRQLAEGLHALHSAGKLHRDIKPSNVLVTPEERVVLLDFGLVSDLGPEGFLHSMHLVGTPAYMSPEQAAGRPVTGASDWYGVGVMLYEALAGTRPFPGEFLDVLVQKQQSEPVPPHEIDSTVPRDLSALCSSLLHKDPRDRPSEDEILRMLSAAPAQRVETRPSPAGPASLFVGRQEHLAALEDALAKTKRGEAVVVLIHGSSGVGKTALARRFLEGPRRDESTVVLSGRCYEQETVPYKALDSLIDALSRYLMRLPRAETEALLPRDVLALTRLFPVLRQVEAVALARRRVVEIPDSLERRRRGFQALRELLGRLADRAPLVLFIDDLQWGDADSAALLLDLFRPPDPPPLLLIGCYRREDALDSPLLKSFSLRPSVSEGLDVREVVVAELAPPEAEEMARSLLASSGASPSRSPQAIARESRGNPLFIDELARYVGERVEPPSGEVAAADDVHLDDVIWARVSRLPDDAQRLLETVAVAGRPLERSTARRAAGLQENDQPALAVLRTGRLLRGSGGAREDQIEIYHDRIRQTVISRLSTEARENVHERLAFALESSSAPDPESLAVHYQGAGSRERAAIYAADAAAKAAEALAFDRAARLYELALELGTTDSATRQRLRVKLGDALANAGRGAEAARAYLAAEGLNEAEALELQRRAADQLLRSGHVDEGLALLRKVLERIGMRLPATPRKALMSFLFRQVQLRLRGFSFRARAASEIAGEDLIRIDTCWSVATGLSMVDSMRARDFQTRHMLLALKAGEPYRVARAMGLEPGYTSYLGGWPARHRTTKLVDRAMALVDGTEHPHARAIAYLGASYAAYLEGRWEASWGFSQKCEEILREQCTGVAWELDMVHITSSRALFLMGRLRELAERLPTFLKEAGERGDLFAATSLRMRYSYLLHLISDEPDRARRTLRRAAERWSQQSFYMQHYFRLFGDAETSLYSDSGQTAWKALLEGWRGLKQSLILRSQYFRIESMHLRARCALAAANSRSLSGSDRAKFLQSATRDARRIAHEKTPWADPLARLLVAGVATFRGKAQDAMTELVAAEAGFDAAKMLLYAASSRRCRGILLGGQEGRALVESADTWMTSERIRNPERMSTMLMPGRWSEG